jgi:S-formylglutathione hydrolase
MYDYVTQELPQFIEAEFPVNQRRSIMGHSMGGHGALMIALKNPQRYRAVSAFSPVVAPSQVPWGQKALSAYLGEDPEAWAQYDTVRLLQAGAKVDGEILVDVGTADPFLEKQLRPELLQVAAQTAGQALRLRRQPGYDHSYYFIASFMGEHIAHHATCLGS